LRGSDHMPDNKESLNDMLKNMSPEQKDIVMKFKSVATAKDPKEKQLAFMNFIGLLKKSKGSLNQRPDTNSLDSITNTITKGLV